MSERRRHVSGCILEADHGAGCVRQQWAADDPDAPWNREAALERAQADGRISMEDADTVRDFAAFLTDPSSRCAICLTDDLDGATRKRADNLGRFPICRTCAELEVG